MGRYCFFVCSFCCCFCVLCAWRNEACRLAWLFSCYRDIRYVCGYSKWALYCWEMMKSFYIGYTHNCSCDCVRMSTILDYVHARSYILYSEYADVCLFQSVTEMNIKRWKGRKCCFHIFFRALLVSSPLFHYLFLRLEFFFYSEVIRLMKEKWNVITKTNWCIIY